MPVYRKLTRITLPLALGLSLLTGPAGGTGAQAHTGATGNHLQTSGSSPVSQLCGPRTLQVAAARLGVTVNAETLLSFCTVTERGTSLLELKQAALYCGLQAQGARLTLEQLQALTTPVILHVDGGHFAMIDGRETRTTPDGAWFQLHDPPHPAEPVSARALQERWDGWALILSRPAIPTQPAPALQFSTLYEDFGTTEQTGLVTRVIEFRNTSDRPLHILEVEKSCGCTEAVTDRQRYAPGESGRLTAQIDLSGRQGPQEQAVRIMTDDPLAAVTEITLRGFVAQPVAVSADQLNFGRLHAGRQAQLETALINRGSRPLELHDWSVEWASPQALPVTLNWSGIAPEDVDRHRLKAGESGLIASVELQVPAGTFPGLYFGTLRIESSYTKSDSVEIPFSAEVLPPVAASQAQVLFGVLNRTAGELQRIALDCAESVDPSSLRVRVTADDHAPAPEVRLAHQARGEWYLECLPPPSALQAPQQRAVRRGQIEILREDEALLVLPWSYVL